MKSHIIFGIIASLVATATLVSQTRQPQTFGALGWDRPTTDEEWAEDVKKENFDSRSTRVLNTMIETHTAKLEREEKEFQRFLDMEAGGQDPTQYLYWEWLESLSASYPNEPRAWIESEALKQAREQYNRELRSIEKLKQSIERMEKEVELRDKGFVIVEGEPADSSFFGSKPYATRTIHD